MNLQFHDSGRRNMVISPVGDDSVHASWLADRPHRTFDVFLIYYGKNGDFGRADADYYLPRQGFKWELLEHALREYRPIFEQYDNIWLPDADVRAHTSTVNRLFELFNKYELRLAQPAIRAGEVSYESLRTVENVVLRYTPYVECMCPLFTREALYTILPTFLENTSGWGIDWVWPRHFSPREMAVIDGASVEHTGKLFRGEHYQKLAKLGIDPNEDFKRVMAKHGGFDKKLHKKFIRGTIKLPAVWEAGKRPLRARVSESLGLQACA